MGSGLDPRVVDQNVHGSKARSDLGEHRLDVLLPTDICSERKRLPANALKLVGELVRRYFVAGKMIDHDATASRGQCQRTASADAGRRASHDRNLVGEPKNGIGGFRRIWIGQDMLAVVDRPSRRDMDRAGSPHERPSAACVPLLIVAAPFPKLSGEAASISVPQYSRPSG